MSKECSRKGPIPEGAYRDLTSDRGRGQGETGGVTALTRASSCNKDDLPRTGGGRAKRLLLIKQHSYYYYES